MTQAVVFLASMLLAAVAAAGVLRPWGSGRAAALERLTDPLEDERISLLRALRDLEDERARGELADQAYVELRAETESRAVAVLRALEAREGAGDLALGDQGARRPRDPRRTGAGQPRRTAGGGTGSSAWPAWSGSR